MKRQITEIIACLMTLLLIPVLSLSANSAMTCWNGSDGVSYTASEIYTRGNKKPSTRRLMLRRTVTPEQAIAATLGAETCHNASKVMDEHGQARFACSECGAWIDSRMLWNPEYRNGESPWVNDCKLNFCPNCGRKVVD